MNIIYKTLFEVKVLHEYYLTEREGNTIFDIADQQGRLDFLMGRLRENYPSISDDLSFEVLSDQQDFFSGHQLKLLPTYSGFQVAIAVQEKVLAGGERVYEPRVTLPDDMPLWIVLQRKNTHMDVISNSSIGPALPASYLFTNESIVSPKTFPYLALPPENMSLLFPYEQGNLVRDPSDNSIRAFYKDLSGNEQWAIINGEGFVTESDRVVISPRFRYSFDHSSSVTSATFTLTDFNGSTLKTIEQDVTRPAMDVVLDFTDVVSGDIIQHAVAPSMIYFLKVSTGNQMDVVHRLVFMPAEMPPDCWALVALQPRVSATGYSLLDDDRLLLTRADAGGIQVPAPVFEIRVKSRFTFWRYRNNRQKKIKANSSLDPYLGYDAQKGTMESISFRNASYVPTIFKDGINTKFLPNPTSYELLSMEKGRVYTEITVPRSDVFDI